ncbi:hypothetical protein A3860_34100 [Niastella vici]|uniref:Uncharacterized protein n=1 Tax=Niastella vici TaxID=1703345 RepID=A0A1V9FPX4_9BACT|nr:hypothetical protein A3860_34100 [Niastella vici]
MLTGSTCDYKNGTRVVVLNWFYIGLVLRRGACNDGVKIRREMIMIVIMVKLINGKMRSQVCMRGMIMDQMIDC